ncbi:hypothetical protein ACKI14_32875, partial [Streptomyces turgidiscabies]
MARVGIGQEELTRTPSEAVEGSAQAGAVGAHPSGHAPAAIEGFAAVAHQVCQSPRFVETFLCSQFLGEAGLIAMF